MPEKEMQQRMGKYDNDEIAKKSQQLLTEDKKELKQQALKHTER